MAFIVFLFFLLAPGDRDGVRDLVGGMFCVHHNGICPRRALR